MVTTDHAGSDTPVIDRVERKDRMTTQEFVYASLRQSILTGALVPGASLTLRGVAENLGVSLTPVREAVRRLSSEHALNVRDNRRIQVPIMTAERFNELIGLRKVIEAHAARSAVPYVSDRQIQVLQDLDQQLDNAIKTGNVAQTMMWNQAFHRSLYQINPAAAGIPLIESLWLQLGPFMRLAARYIQTLYVVDYHVQALEALQARDADALDQAIRDDIQAGADCLDMSIITSLEKTGKLAIDAKSEGVSV